MDQGTLDTLRSNYILEELKQHSSKIADLEKRRHDNQRYTLVGLTGFYAWYFSNKSSEIEPLILIIPPLLILCILHSQSRMLIWITRLNHYIKNLEIIVLRSDDLGKFSDCGWQHCAGIDWDKETKKSKCLASFRNRFGDTSNFIFLSVGDVAYWGFLLFISCLIALAG